MKPDVIEESDAVLGARMKELFVAQHDKPSALGEINLSRLTPFQRGMLVTDGTVTRFIEAYTMAPVEVVRLQQSERMLSGGHPWLELPIGAKVISRQSVIRVHTPNGSPSTIHVYADSLIVPHRLPKSFLDALASDREGIGRAPAANRSGESARTALVRYGVIERSAAVPSRTLKAGSSSVAPTGSLRSRKRLC